MTVRELIQHLDLFSQEAEVKVEAHHSWRVDRDVESVGIDPLTDAVIITAD
jgi:hypothetical protein